MSMDIAFFRFVNVSDPTNKNRNGVKIPPSQPVTYPHRKLSFGSSLKYSSKPLV
jgi:hypothetical protein